MNKIKQMYWDCRNFIREEVFEPVWYRLFGHKHHIIKTDLEPTSWIDTDVRMLYGVMSLVEWFVENDMRIWSPQERIEEIDRIADSKESDAQKADQIAALRNQWGADDRIMEIYHWWKNYPNRMEEIQVASSKWYSYVCGFKKSEDEFTCMVSDRLNSEQKAEERRLLNMSHELEQKLEKEEQEMLKLAVELRGRMWS